MKPIDQLEPLPSGTAERLRNNNIVQAWLVLLLALFFGSSLAGIQITLGPKIEENKINETREQVPALVLGLAEAEAMAAEGKALEITPQTVLVEKNGRQVGYSVFEAVLPDGERAGWVVKAKGQGYADKIELLLGVGPDVQEIRGVFVLDQKETPGLGNKITTDEWRSQFQGKPTSEYLTVVKGGGAGSAQIDAITGATISSRAVTTIVNTAIADLKGPLSSK